MVDLTEAQRADIRHALGLPNRRDVTTRSHYVCDPDPWWDSLVALGLVRTRQRTVFGNVYWVGRRLAAQVLEAHEGIDHVIVGDY